MALVIHLTIYVSLFLNYRRIICVKTILGNLGYTVLVWSKTLRFFLNMCDHNTVHHRPLLTQKLPFHCVEMAYLYFLNVDPTFCYRCKLYLNKYIFYCQRHFCLQLLHRSTRLFWCLLKGHSCEATFNVYKIESKLHIGLNTKLTS